MARGIKWNNEEEKYFAELWTDTKLNYEEMQKLLNNKFKNGRSLKALSSKLTLLIKAGKLPTKRPSLLNSMLEEESVKEEPSKFLPEIKECDEFYDHELVTHTVPFKMSLVVDCEVELEVYKGLDPEEIKREVEKQLAILIRSKSEVANMIQSYSYGDEMDIDPLIEPLGGYEGGYACAR